MHFPTSSLASTLAINTLHNIKAPAIGSLGCGKPLPTGLVPGGPSVNFTINVPQSGGERTYLLHLPTHFSPKNSKPSPMILVFHGYGQPTSSIEEITRLSYSDTNTRYISVYPEGIENVWLGDPGSPHPELDDRPLINSLLDELENNFCVDKSRIYTTGLSNGGGFSGLLACYPPTSSRIAAFSAVSGAYYLQESLNQTLFEKEGCQPGNIPRKIPYLHIHGKKDMVIAYNGDNSGFDIDQNHIPDPDTLPIPTWLQDWVERNGCLKDGSVNRYLKTGHVSNSTTVMENGSVERSVWTCAGYQDVVTGYLVKELGHGWPSTVPLGGILEEFRLGPSAWNASALLMDWFGRWSLSE